MVAKEPKIVSTRQGEAETLSVGDLIVTFLASGEETQGALSVMEFIVSPQTGTGLHIHKAEHEMGYVMEGTFQFTIGEQTGTLTAGDWAFIPKGTIHEFTNLGSGRARVLGIYSPSGFDGYFREMAPLLASVNGPPDASALVTLNQKYHVEFILAPGSPDSRPSHAQNPTDGEQDALAE